jgi:addiction module HigA family antidote
LIYKDRRQDGAINAMSKFASFFGSFSGSIPKRPVGSLRAEQRRQRMSDAGVSLADVRADALELEGRPAEPARPIHPGEILWEEYMKPLGLKAPTTAKAMGVPRTRIERLVAGQTALSPDTALRLSRAFGAQPMFWMNLQAAYDLEVAEQELTNTLAAIKPLQGRMGLARA